MAFDFSSSEELASSWAYLDEDHPSPKSAVDMHLAIEKGLPSSMLVHFREVLRELPDKTWAQILAISLTQFKRLRGSGKPLGADVGSQLVMFAVLFAKAEDVLGGRDEALSWFREQHMALSGQRPIDMLDTFIGAALVDRTLRQIDYGVYL